MTVARRREHEKRCSLVLLERTGEAECFRCRLNECTEGECKRIEVQHNIAESPSFCRQLLLVRRKGARYDYVAKGRFPLIPVV